MTQPKPAVKRGDVALALFPNSNLTSAKTRPALIVQADNLQTRLSQIHRCNDYELDARKTLLEAIRGQLNTISIGLLKSLMIIIIKIKSSDSRSHD